MNTRYLLRYAYIAVILVFCSGVFAAGTMTSKGVVRINPKDGAEMVWVPKKDSSMGRFNHPILNAGRAYPPADLVISQELRADLTGDGDLDRVVIGCRQPDNGPSAAYVCIYMKANISNSKDDYHEVYRDYLGQYSGNIRLEEAPQGYSGGTQMLVASGSAWTFMCDLNVEMVVWDIQKHQFERIFSAGARYAFPVVRDVQLLDVDNDVEKEVVVFSDTTYWTDPRLQHTFRVYKWNPKQRRYLLISKDRPMGMREPAGWIRRE